MFTAGRTITAPPSVVWNVLVDLEAWPRWGPTVSAAWLDSPYSRLELGATGMVRTMVGLALPFTITEFDPGRHWAWKVAGVDATHHGVEPADGGARASMAVPWWAPSYLPVCSLALRRINVICTAGP